MKPLLKRKGNSDTRGTPVPKPRPLNESPSEKEGKSHDAIPAMGRYMAPQ